jgi:ectoine hydroxylase-related dioxygenase (phytanoyl-CoA dioxygenase family)
MAVVATGPAAGPAACTMRSPAGRAWFSTPSTSGQSTVKCFDCAAYELGRDPGIHAQVTSALQDDGVCVVKNVLDQELVDRSMVAAMEKYELCLQLAEKYHGGFKVGYDNGFAEAVQRSKGRFDILFGMNRDPAFSWPAERWRRLLGATLGEPTLLFNGMSMAIPGAEPQRWHADGEHLFGTGTGVLPAHCVTAFVPLIDITANNGTTEFCVGSHKITNTVPEITAQSDAHKESIGFNGPVEQVLCPAGSLILFDFRILRRCLANTSQEPRPMLYYTHARPWFQDMKAFPERSIVGTPIEAKDIVKGKVVTMAEKLRFVRKKVDGGMNRWGELTKSNASISKSCN